jgi:Cd2+/Zn2+-exporting ATPase
VELRPDTARRVSENGAEQVVAPEAVAVGETILVKPGERVPLDGAVTAGESLLDVSALTGEPRPQHAKAGDAVQAGSVNTTGPLTIRVTRAVAESSTSRLLRAVEDATKHKPAIERFITRFSRGYTPAVIGAAALLAVLPRCWALGAGANGSGAR